MLKDVTSEVIISQPITTRLTCADVRSTAPYFRIIMFLLYKTVSQELNIHPN